MQINGDYENLSNCSPKSSLIKWYLETAAAKELLTRHRRWARNGRPAFLPAESHPLLITAFFIPSPRAHFNSSHWCPEEASRTPLSGCSVSLWFKAPSSTCYLFK